MKYMTHCLRCSSSHSKRDNIWRCASSLVTVWKRGTLYIHNNVQFHWALWWQLVTTIFNLRETATIQKYVLNHIPYFWHILDFRNKFVIPRNIWSSVKTSCLVVHGNISHLMTYPRFIKFGSKQCFTALSTQQGHLSTKWMLLGVT